MTGVELSDEYSRIATERESTDQLGIEYHNRSATDLSFLKDATFDKAVSNYVLMDIVDYELALAEVARVLKLGSSFVMVISHPAFSSGPRGWVIPAVDSPRVEDRDSWRSDTYFHRDAYL